MLTHTTDTPSPTGKRLYGEWQTYDCLNAESRSIEEERTVCIMMMTADDGRLTPRQARVEVADAGLVLYLQKITLEEREHIGPQRCKGDHGSVWQTSIYTLWQTNQYDG